MQKQAISNLQQIIMMMRTKASLICLQNFLFLDEQSVSQIMTQIWKIENLQNIMFNQPEIFT